MHRRVDQEAEADGGFRRLGDERKTRSRSNHVARSRPCLMALCCMSCASVTAGNCTSHSRGCPVSRLLACMRSILSQLHVDRFTGCALALGLSLLPALVSTLALKHIQSTNSLTASCARRGSLTTLLEMYALRWAPARGHRRHKLLRAQQRVQCECMKYTHCLAPLWPWLPR